MSINYAKPETLFDPLRDAIREHKRYDIPRPMRIDMSQFPKIVDGEHIKQLDNFGWSLRLEYHIDTYGERKTQVDDGVAHEVTILQAYLRNERVEQEINLRLLGHDVSELEAEIGLKLDGEQE